MYDVDIVFYQDISIERTGFGNNIRIDIGDPYIPDRCFAPIAGDGCKVIDYDRHPYIAASGYGIPGTDFDFPELAVTRCMASMSIRYGDSYQPLPAYTREYTLSPSRWGVAGEKTSFDYTVAYNSTIEAQWWLNRVVFYKVHVMRSDGAVMTFSNVPAREGGNKNAMFRMWGETESWGSESQSMLVIPHKEYR